MPGQSVTQTQTPLDQVLIERQIGYGRYLAENWGKCQTCPTFDDYERHRLGLAQNPGALAGGRTPTATAAPAVPKNPPGRPHKKISPAARRKMSEAAKARHANEAAALAAQG